MRYRFLSVLLALPFSVLGQLDPDYTNGLILPYWAASDIIMSDREEFSGEIQFNLVDQPLGIQLKIDDNYFELPVTDIKEFSFYDSLAARTRTFTSIYHRRKRRKVLMEYRGQNSSFGVVWYRFPKTVWRDEGAGSAPHTSLKDERYLYVKNTQEILPLNFESLMKICAPRQNEVRNFIRESNLKIETVKSYMDVLNFYEELLMD